MTANPSRLLTGHASSFDWVRKPTTRDDLFAGILILAAINGLWGRSRVVARDSGWSSALFNPDISVIVLLAFVESVWLLLNVKSTKIGPIDYVVATICLIFILLPIFALSWAAIIALGLY